MIRLQEGGHVGITVGAGEVITVFLIEDGGSAVSVELNADEAREVAARLLQGTVLLEPADHMTRDMKQATSPNSRY